MAVGSLDAALHVVAGPLHAARVALEMDHVLAGLGVLEPQDAPVASDIHRARAGLNLVSREAAYTSFWH